MRKRVRGALCSVLRFLLGVDSVACGFSLLSMMFICHLSRFQPNFRSYFFLFLHDLVIMVLMISGCSAASAIGYVGRYGEERTGWLAVCDQVAKFCNRTLASIILSYLAFFCYFALSIISAHKLALLSKKDCEGELENGLDQEEKKKSVESGGESPCTKIRAGLVAKGDLPERVAGNFPPCSGSLLGYADKPLSFMLGLLFFPSDPSKLKKMAEASQHLDT
ncbi:hypothetical protein SAY86_009700 [Trapa natans]|uniref:CASP-like protein n=1 Tax=Trapa natans TaxID=22666 RepID=A0AAN7KXB9_TRANT|nr:hypothetical protein SAY86_009700 [Trapa natans]